MREECNVAVSPDHWPFNLPVARFLALLTQHEIEALVDIRRFPGSRKHPHFNQDSLAAALSKAGVEYDWLEVLGGRRHKKQGESPNLGLQNQSFRNYGDYLLTDDLQEGVRKLLEITKRKRAAVLPSSLPISAYLLALSGRTIKR